MREAGTLPGESAARNFGDYLYALGIENEVEPASDGGWALWVLDDDHLARAQEELEAYRANPSDARFLQGARAGRERWKQDRKQAATARSEIVDVRTTWNRANFFGVGFITGGLILLSCGFSIVLFRNEDVPIFDFLVISNYIRPILPEIRGGQVWRLVTPIFLHFGILHLAFNMLWLKDLGSQIENREGSLFFVLAVLALAIPSNLVQYAFTGPNFGGMSGVVYGLLGYIWARKRRNPASEYNLDQTTVIMMAVWFALCWTGILGPIANWAHTVGLAAGVALGFLVPRRRG
ncbi:MAG: rhomboid protease GlpG [Candidatus Sumerlaeota bacterium]|nr:rhomboid protease GlpG [Candidatus Sumerlaeota bacterium]